MINSAHLFALALGVVSPWKVEEVKFSEAVTGKELHIEINFEKGAKFADEAGTLCPVFDTKQKTWRHLNFFEHKCYLHCRVPRIKTSEGKVRLVEVPWSRSGSGFTLLFEAFAMCLIEGEMPVNKVGNTLKEDAHRIWTIFNYWIKKAYNADAPGKIERLGIDETSRRKGHQYVTVGIDFDERRVLHATEGKDKKAVKAIKNHLVEKKVNIEKIKYVCIDFSPSFIPGVSEEFPGAQIHFDKFHLIQMLNKAMDEVRRLERKEHDELKGHKYTFLKNKANLSSKKQGELAELITLFPTLGEAYRLKELFNDLWDMETENDAKEFLHQWCHDIEKAKINPFIEFAKTVKIHIRGIINFVSAKINNGVLEGINCKIQLAKRRARGFRNLDNFINMIYFLCGKLKFDYPLVSS